MRGVNMAIIVGNLGQDPDTKYTASGAAVTNISVATTSAWKDKDSGEMQENTEWHRIVFFGKLAEIAGQYLHKGSQVYVSGRLQTRKWQDKDGKDRYTTEIVANEMQMLGGKSGGPSYPSTDSSRTEQAAPDSGGFIDDDIPFAPFERGTVA